MKTGNPQAFHEAKLLKLNCDVSGCVIMYQISRFENDAILRTMEDRKGYHISRIETFEFSKIWSGLHFLPDFSKNQDLIEDISDAC
jgi:hypothetical protein